MEKEISYDIGEEIIAKLKELNEIFERIMRQKNEKECTSPSYNGIPSAWETKRTGPAKRSKSQ